MSQQTRATMSDTEIPTAVKDNPPDPPPAWITPALLARTIEVWSASYRRPVSVSEAEEILRNVKRLGDVLLCADEANGEPRRVSTSVA